VEQKRLLTYTLKLLREWGDEHKVAPALSDLSEAIRLLNLREEGIQCAKEALGIFERLGNTADQARCLIALARALYDSEQFDAAVEATSRAIDILPEKGEQLYVCRGHRLLGDTHDSKG